MAIAYVGAGAPVGVDGSTVSAISIPYPSGYAATNLLLLFVTTDSFEDPITPTGWSHLMEMSVGRPTTSPFAPYPTTNVYYRIATGSEGTSLVLVLPTAAWPDGSPFTTAVIMAYSGTDQTSPIGEFGSLSTKSTVAAQSHQTLVTSSDGEWMITVRSSSAQSVAMTFTVSGGTNISRVNALDNQSELSMGIFDSNGPLAAGTQTTRITTSSASPTFGSNMGAFTLRAPTPSIAQAPLATAEGTAYGAAVEIQNGEWNSCGEHPQYTFAIDWGGDGDFTTPGDDVTGDILDATVTIAYGRDDDRQLSPPKTGSAAFSLINVDRKYSPDNPAGELYGDLDPARQCKGTVEFAGTEYPLMFQRVDDFTVHADMDNRTVDFTFLDGLNLLSGETLSTGVLSGQRTGTLINYILDQINWSGGRDIDPGVTVVPWWYVDGTDALTAVNDLVKSDGPPAIAYVAPDNTFVFRDRHHRILNSDSVSVQATFSGNALMDCTAGAVTGLEFTAPFDYETGWKNIVNYVTFTVSERAPSTSPTAVWSSDSTISLSTGQSRVITASGSDPFVNAIVPVAGVDYVLTGSGTADIQLLRTSGVSTTLVITAVGAPITISGLQLRAQAISVRNTVTVTQTDAGSIAAHGTKSYGDDAPWAGVNDAFAVAEAILLRYSRRLPTVSLRITAKDPAHFVQLVSRRISDRIHIVNGEMGIDDDYFIENVSHTIQRMNNDNGAPPVHAVVFGCEKETVVTSNPFRFDVRGAGFDDGVFDQVGSSDPATVFVFGDVTRGIFDFGTFGL